MATCVKLTREGLQLLRLIFQAKILRWVPDCKSGAFCADDEPQLGVH